MTPTSAPSVILSIDDEPQLLADIVDELQRAGYVVLAAPDAATAYELVGERRPDLILCDISMPGGDGYSVLDNLRRLPELDDVPFVFLTAMANRADVIVGKRLGADDYLTKPVDYDLLLATVAARLGQIRRLKQAHDNETEALRRQGMQALRAEGQAGVALAGQALDRASGGLILLDAAGVVVETNKIAAAILAGGDALKIRDGHLLTREPDALALAMAGLEQNAETTLVLDRDGRQPLLLRVSKLSGPLGGAQFAVTITDPERAPPLSPQLAIALYGLTPTEAKLAVAVAGSKRPEEISADLGIAQSTINFHLNSIFRKTGTTRQVDLVSLLLRTIIAHPNSSVGATSRP